MAQDALGLAGMPEADALGVTHNNPALLIPRYDARDQCCGFLLLPFNLALVEFRLAVLALGGEARALVADGAPVKDSRPDAPATLATRFTANVPDAA